MVSLLMRISPLFLKKYTTFVVLFFALVNFAFYFVNRLYDFSFPFLALVGYTTFALVLGLILHETITNGIEARYRKVEEENKEFADRYIEIEEQNNNLANLYVASYQLHSTLDFKEVVRIVQEIVINLIGAEVFHVLMVSEKTGQLEVEASEGQTPGRTTIPIGDGLIGKAAQTGENFFSESVARRDPSPFEEPLAVIPLKIKDSTIGVISINKLLVHKKQFTSMDYELFTLLAGHAATAAFSAKLYSTSARKLTTLQGFLDMLKQK